MLLENEYTDLKEIEISIEICQTYADPGRRKVVETFEEELRILLEGNLARRRLR